MADMVDSGITEGVLPDTQAIPQGHGVEARLALADRVRKGFGIPTVIANQLHLTPANAALAAHPAVLDETDLLIEPAANDLVESDVHHHPVQEVVGRVEHHHHHTQVQEPGQVLQDNLPSSVASADGMNEGLLSPDIPDLAHVDAEDHPGNNAVPLRDGSQSFADVHDGLFGQHSAAQPHAQSVYGGALSQLFAFGVPFAFIFAAASLVLWRRLGDPRLSTSKI